MRNRQREVRLRSRREAVSQGRILGATLAPRPSGGDDDVIGTLPLGTSSETAHLVDFEARAR
jgi:hypothetical protein